jgi:hypothetical protein
MKKDRWFYRNVILDYIPFLLLEKVSVKNIYDWSDFLYSNEVFEIKEVYSYLDNKIKEFDKSK